MSLEAATVVSIPSLGRSKMEDRKRAIASDHHDDMSPPAKRIATDVRTSLSEPADPIKFGTEGSPWQVELETFQKDAILRQLQEYKREKKRLESQLDDLERRGRSHDDLLRFVESYVDQFLDEVRVLSGNLDSVGVKTGDPIVSTLTSPSSSVTASNEIFQKYLASRIPAIKSAIDECLSKLPAAPGDIRMLQQKLTETLGNLKIEQKALDKIRLEKDALQTGLESATERYLKAEKRLDRMRSVVVTNLEKQGHMASTMAPENEQVNGDSSSSASKVDSTPLNELKVEAKKALLEAEKRKEHMDKLEEETKKLTAEVTTLTTRLTCLSDEDFAKTDLFKASKAQQEDLIKRINHLEATNIQLREEAKKYQAERMAYRRQVDEESRKVVEESEQQLGKLDADLQRIRQERDLLQDKVAILKASKPEFRTTIEKLELISKAKDERIAAFEEQVQWLQIAAKEVEVQQPQELDSLSNDELRSRVASLRKELDGLKSELPHMEQAYTKYHSLAMKKVNEFRAFEERISQLNAEKAKADQKFYGAMKDKDARDAQNKILQTQNSKTSALISAFKENEAKLHEALRNLEKQVAEHQATVTEMTSAHQVALQQAQQSEATARHISLNVVDLKKKLSEKDEVLIAAQKAQRETEIEVEKLKVEVTAQKQEAEDWRNKARKNPTEEVDLLRRVAYCTSCQRNLKNTMIKTCNHVLCRECVNERIQSRSRKCPHCLKPFGLNDSVPVHLV